MLIAEIIIDLFFLTAYIIVLIFLIYSLWALPRGAPFVPLKKENVEAMIKTANPQKGENLVDLGSGDGRILIAACRTGANCVGVEFNPVLCFLSRLKARIKGCKNIKIRCADLWKFSLEDVDILTLYFISNKMDRLYQKIKKEMKPGARIVSYGFTFPHWQYTRKNGKIYLYVVK